jgi:hypothetical protein
MPVNRYITYFWSMYYGMELTYYSVPALHETCRDLH